jgi:hypothetical protein
VDSPQRTPPAHRFLDTASGILLLAMVVFAPWALACTEALTIWIMNVSGYALGAMLVGKWWVRRRADFGPERWDFGPGSRWAVWLLAASTIAILGYVLVSALNWRAIADYTFPPGSPRATGVEFSYRDPIPWLPHSYDGPRTLRAFWKYLAMALAFWAARDWLLTKSRRERHLEGDRPDRFPTDRLQWLLWTLTISGTLLSFVGIVQRLEGTPKLLWLFEHINAASFSFGPFAYRANGAQYANLIWPVVLGFWWALHLRNQRRRGPGARTGGDAHVVLLPCGLLIALCPVVSSSRGGAVMMGGLMVAATIVLLTARTSNWIRGVLVLSLAVFAIGAWSLGGETLMRRMETIQMDRMGGREELHENARRMVEDFPVWGSGAETFARLFYLYKPVGDVWDAYAHDDFLETRITFGWVGLGLVLVALFAAPAVSFSGAGLPATREFFALWLIAMGGMMVHARFDLPFQVYALHFQFVIMAAVLSCLVPRQTQVPGAAA